MTRTEALLVAGLWHTWRADREMDSRIYRRFVFRVVLAHPRLKHLDCFEVLDAIANEAAWRELGQSVRRHVGVSAESAAGAETGEPPEHRTGGEARSAGIVEVEQTSD